MNFQRIMLTGGAGFIGSHLAEALLRRSATLAIIDSLDDYYSTDWKKANLQDISKVGDYEFHSVDICDMDRLRRIVSQFHPHVIIHLAARAGVRPSIEAPLTYERVNVGGTLNLLELCRELNIRKFVFGSSSSVYGASSKAPFSEDHIEGRPISPYAATKLSGELFCYTYAHLFGIEVICLRFFTVYGPRQRPDLAIYKFTSQIEGARPIRVFGDGTSGRDYTHVEDIVTGILAALNYDPPRRGQAIFEVFNLGNSHPVTLAELLELLEKITGKKAIRQQGPSQPGDVPLTWANIEKARNVLNYYPKIDLEHGIQDFVSWFRSADIRCGRG